MPLAIIQSQQCVSVSTRRLKLALRAGTRANGARGRVSYWRGSIRPKAAGIQINHMKKPQQSLKKWTEQKWRTSDGSPSKGKKRYLPDAAWSALSPAEKAATNRAKAKGNKAGKQFVKQPKKIAQKTSRYR